jgi:cytochrome c biogenesis protein CcmG/thiol:disulfide interchange protein DsbE
MMRAGEGNRTPIFGLGSQRLGHWTTPAGGDSLSGADNLGDVRMRLFWPVTLAAAALVGLLAYGVVAKGADTTLDDAIAKGGRPDAPAMTLPRLGGSGSASLADYKGKVVVLNMWASWCDPCRDEVPLLQKTHERIAAQGGVVLGVDTQDARGDALGFLKEAKATFPSLRDRDRTYGRDFGVTGYPETFLIDRKGRVAALRRFPVTQRWLDQHLTPLLAESS